MFFWSFLDVCHFRGLSSPRYAASDACRFRGLSLQTFFVLAFVVPTFLVLTLSVYHQRTQLIESVYQLTETSENTADRVHFQLTYIHPRTQLIESVYKLTETSENTADRVRYQLIETSKNTADRVLLSAHRDIRGHMQLIESIYQLTETSENTAYKVRLSAHRDIRGHSW